MEKLLYLRLVLIVLSSFLLTSSVLQAQSGNKMTKWETSKWYNSHELLNGQQLKPHKSVDQKELAMQYQANRVWWDKAFEFMKENDLTKLEPGTYPIDGENVYAMVTEGPGKDFEQGKWESHRHYNDIQYVIRGRERIGIAPVSSLTIIDPYDNSKDIVFYSGKGEYYIANSKIFFIFFPQNAHRPGIKLYEDKIKKIVIKVRTGV